MKKVILAGMSISLLAGMILTACSDTQTAVKEESSIPASSVRISAETSSEQKASISSETIASEAVSADKVTSSKKSASSQASISSEESIIEYPITHINTDPIGHTISFSEGIALDVGDFSEGKWLDVKIIRSQKQLQLICQNGSSGTPQKYDSKFFQNNALIVIYVVRNGDAALSDSVNTLTVNSNKLGISMSYWFPDLPSDGARPCVIGQRLINLEAQKSDIANISKIEVYNRNDNN